MIVSALDKNDDWGFGRGKANYITGGAAIAQKAKCRIRSFKTIILSTWMTTSTGFTCYQRKHRAGDSAGDRARDAGDGWGYAHYRSGDGGQ